MEIEYDPTKDAINRAKHGLALERAKDMDLSAALQFADKRRDYGESRDIAIRSDRRSAACLGLYHARRNSTGNLAAKSQRPRKKPL